MSGEIQAFKAELRQAGQPWSGWGVFSFGVGLVGLLISQLVQTPMAVWLALGSLAPVAAGWIFLVLAALKRRRWAKTHPIEVPALTEPGSS
jgi:hypothetical protein